MPPSASHPLRHRLPQFALRMGSRVARHPLPSAARAGCGVDLGRERRPLVPDSDSFQGGKAAPRTWIGLREEANHDPLHTPLSQPEHGRQRAAVLWMVLAALIFAAMALLTKQVAKRLPGPEVALVRFLSGL